MAHHNNTPLSVLMAPDATFTVAHAAPGLNRDERRGRVPVTVKRRLETHGLSSTPFVGNVRRDVLGIKVRVPRHRPT